MRDCHVRRLVIQAPDAATAARGAVLVEDALRTASLPGESSRLLIVRKLHIGALPVGANATAVSRRIEAALAQTPVQAVAAADPAAASAAAVYFADEVEACVQLAVLGARGHAPDAWFWPRAVVGWRNGYGAAYAVRCALGAAARRPEGPEAAAHAVRRVVAGLLAAGVLDAALAALEPEDGPVLLRLYGWRPPAPSAGAAAEAVHVQHALSAQQVSIVRRHFSRLGRWAAAWGAGDARTLWLAAALLAVEQGDRRSQTQTGSSILAQEAGTLVQQVIAPPAQRMGKESAGPAPATSPLVGPAVPAAQPSPSAGAPQLRELGSSPAGLHPPPEAQASSFASSAGAQPPLDDAEEAPGAAMAAQADPAAPIWWRGLPLLPTAAAGLWFLLPVLARLGIRAWLDEHWDMAGVGGSDTNPEFGLPWQVLAELARRAETPPLDPVWAVLRQGAETEFFKQTQLAETRFLVSSDGAGQPVAWWCDRVQEWCASLYETEFRHGLDEGGLPLAAIVRRRGWLYTTATHIDVFFDLAQADLRLRRHGLDLDPGWLPWFRRVVTFYYEAGLAQRGPIL